MAIMPISISQNKAQYSIGAVFTPLEWACFAIEEFGIYKKWMSGESVFDPTMGEGNLLEALIALALKNGVDKGNVPVERLFGVELNSGYFNAFFLKIKELYDIDLPRKNFQNADIFFLDREFKCDILFGNPPWITFADLPEDYKNQIKSKFFEFDLIGNAKDMLLGGSRIDLAALVIKKTLSSNLNKNGMAVFFLPLSLLLNDGANKRFRNYRVNEVKFKVDTFYDFNDTLVFEDVSTRYGLVKLIRDAGQEFPIPVQRKIEGRWIKNWAKPAFLPDDPLSLTENAQSGFFQDLEMIVLPHYSMPRQGINTCGANDCFFFDQYEALDERVCAVSNATHSAVLPIKYVHPLLTAKNFRNNATGPIKWVFLPYRNDGKPLEPRQVLDDEMKKVYPLQRRSIEKQEGNNVVGMDQQRLLVGNAWGRELQFFPL